MENFRSVDDVAIDRGTSEEEPVRIGDENGELEREAPCREKCGIFGGSSSGEVIGRWSAGANRGETSGLCAIGIRRK